MTARNDLDQLLAAWFAADSAEREPDHLLERVLEASARTRRRPAWRIPERWLSMSAITRRSAALPRMPWRLAGAVALLVLALVIGAALMAGGQSRRLPAPFGPAANGLVLYSADGDIYTADPATGTTHALIAGQTTDLDPAWSLDGTRFAFRRQQPDGDVLYVARADGSRAVPITGEPLTGIESVSFSPDGREVLFTFVSHGRKIAIAGTDGSGTRTLDLPMPAQQPAYQPPNGAQIAFIGMPDDPSAGGVYLVKADGRGLRTLVEPSLGNTAESPRWSPDGSLLAYDSADFTVTNWTVQTHVISPDGSGDRTLPLPADALWSGEPVWSNGGDRIAMVRGYSPYGDEDLVLTVLPADGSQPGVATPRSVLAGWPSGIAWAPDDSAILVVPDANQETQPLLVDPLTGAARPAPWATISRPAWQRLAP